MADPRAFVTVLIFCAGVVLIFWGIASIWRTIGIRGGGGTAEGRVIDRREGREDAFITVSFSIAQDRVVHFEQREPFFRKTKYTVFYDPAWPERATVSPRLDILSGLFLLGFGALFVLETSAKMMSMLTR